jgi:hypothetical protein
MGPRTGRYKQEKIGDQSSSAAIASHVQMWSASPAAIAGVRGYGLARLLWGKLKGGGATGRDDYGTVYRTLNRDRRFVRSDKGEFSLTVVSPSAPEQPSEQSPAVLPD